MNQHSGILTLAADQRRILTDNICQDAALNLEAAVYRARQLIISWQVRKLQMLFFVPKLVLVYLINSIRRRARHGLFSAINGLRYSQFGVAIDRDRGGYLGSLAPEACAPSFVYSDIKRAIATRSI